MRLRAITITFMVLSLLVSSCSLVSSSDESEWNGKVGDGEVRAELGSVTVIFPDDVAPAGTKATIRIDDADNKVPNENSVSMSDVVEVVLENGLQPQVPVTINMPIKTNTADLSTIADSYLLFGSSTSEDGTEAFFTGTLNSTSGVFSMTVDHFSKFKILGVDLGKIFGEVKTAIMQGIGLEFPAPDCVGIAAVVNGTTYDVESPGAAYMCLDEDDGSLVVTAYPAIAMPYLVSSNPQADGITAATEAGIGTAGIIAIARQLDLLDSSSNTGLFPGSKAIYTFDGAPESVHFDLNQYPVLLLMSILAKTLDVLGVTTIEALDGLQCFADVADSSSRLNEGIKADGMGAFIKSFFTCAGTLGDLSPLGKVLLAVLSAGPSFLATSVVGFINEFSGQSHQEIDLIVTPPELPEEPKEPQATDLLNAMLPPNVCTTGTGGWAHSSGIQLVDGRGAAYTPSGAFDGAGVMSTTILGTVDIDGDSKQEVIMSLMCSGSEPENCCAGRSSIANTIAAFSIGNGQTLTQIGSSLMGGTSGPASRQIKTAELSGNSVVTSEYIVYPEQYASGEVGGNPNELVTVEYSFSNGDWIASRP